MKKIINIFYNLDLIDNKYITLIIRNQWHKHASGDIVYFGFMKITRVGYNQYILGLLGIVLVLMVDNK